MTNLSKKLGEMNFDGLFTDVVPAVQVRDVYKRQLLHRHDGTVEFQMPALRRVPRNSLV